HRQDPDRSLLALEAIEEVARETAAEIDHIVGTLREGGSANGVVEAPTGLASLETLIARHREAGLEVTFDASGTPRRRGAAADRGSKRLPKEAPATAPRHGAGSARIDLAFGDESVEVTVTNPMPDRRPLPAGGHGLIGMRERATLLGGTFDAKPTGVAFRVR